ncbi:MAG: InlB B-repeat-containing protein, partial [Candidatus Gallimonas sp.]
PLGAVSYGEDKTDTIDVRAIAAASVTADNASVTLSADSVIYGTTQITLIAAEGKLITGVTVPEECSAQKNADGSYTVTVVRPVTSVAESYALTVTTDNALSVTVTVSGSGRVSYLGAEISGGIVVPESESYYLSAVPSAGFETTVTAGGIAVEASEQGYLIPAGTSAVEVAFTRLQAKLTVSLGENGTATLGGEALSAGEYTLDQGETHLLTVLPARGYEATVTLGGETLTPGDEGYEIVLDGDSALSVTFAPAVYTITYDLDRGTNGSNPQTYTVNDAVTFEAATKEGYTFLYWYVLDGDTEREITGIEQGSVGDLTVHAKFEMNAVEPAKGGCGSVAFGGGFAAVALCAAALVALGKKRK